MKKSWRILEKSAKIKKSWSVFRKVDMRGLIKNPNFKKSSNILREVGPYFD